MNVTEFLMQTPWWVYVIFIYILYVGIKATRGGDIHLWRLFILPVIFVLLGIDTLMENINITSSHVILWLVAILIGAGVGAWQVYRLGITVNRKKLTATFPGTWSTLIFVLLVFFIKYYYAYELAMNPRVVLDHQFVYTMLFVSGFLTGTFVGRLCYVLYRFRDV